MPTHESGELLNERQAAAYLQKPLSTLRTWRYEERGPVVTKTDGYHVRYQKSDLDLFKTSGNVRARWGAK